MSRMIPGITNIKRKLESARRIQAMVIPSLQFFPWKEKALHMKKLPFLRKTL
jgi:hypothetical protein